MKGQLMIDILMMVLSFSIVLVLLLTTATPNTSALAYRHEYSENQRTLITILETNVNASGKTGRAIDLITTGTGLLDVNQQLNQTLYQLNNGERNYILYSPGRIWAYDKQPTACMEQIPVAQHEYTNWKGEQITVMYGSWPSWMDLPQTC